MHIRTSCCYRIDFYFPRFSNDFQTNLNRLQTHKLSSFRTLHRICTHGSDGKIQFYRFCVLFLLELHNIQLGHYKATVHYCFWQWLRSVKSWNKFFVGISIQSSDLTYIMYFVDSTKKKERNKKKPNSSKNLKKKKTEKQCTQQESEFSCAFM